MRLPILDERALSHFAIFELPVASYQEVADTRKQKIHLCISCTLEGLESIATIEHRLLAKQPQGANRFNVKRGI